MEAICCDYLDGTSFACDNVAVKRVHQIGYPHVKHNVCARHCNLLIDGGHWQHDGEPQIYDENRDGEHLLSCATKLSQRANCDCKIQPINRLTDRQLYVLIDLIDQVGQKGKMSNDKANDLMTIKIRLESMVGIERI